MSGDGATRLAGGDGDDDIEGMRSRLADSPTSFDLHEWRVDDAADTLDGGAGDDSIQFSQLDLVTGGTGEDELEGWVTPDDTGPAVVGDFAQGEDHLSLVVEDESASIQDFGARFEVVETDGNTEILLDGTHVVTLTGATGLTIRLSENGEGPYYDLNGNRTDEPADVTLTTWQNVY